MNYVDSYEQFWYSSYAVLDWIVWVCVSKSWLQFLSISWRGKKLKTLPMTYYDDFCVQQCNWCSSTFEIIQLQLEFKVAKLNNLASFFQYKNYISKNALEKHYIWCYIKSKLNDYFKMSDYLTVGAGLYNFFYMM